MLRSLSFARTDTRRACLLLAGSTLLLAAVLATRPAWAASAPGTPGNLDAARLQAADSEPQNWFTGGRDKDSTYYSPLASIDAKNVGQLGFAWQYDLGSPMRGQEATPIVIDGKPVDMHISIGIALSPDHADDIDSLRRAADEAMYTAKRKGGAMLAFADED